MINTQFIRSVYLYSFYLLIFVFGLANIYLLLIMGGITIALGVFALLVCICYFFSGWLLSSIFGILESHTKKISVIYGIGLTLFTIVLTVAGQQNNLFDGLGHGLTTTSIGILLSSFVLGLSSSITLKSLNSLRRSKHKVEITESNWKNKSFLVGISIGILMGFTWGVIVIPSFGLMIGAIFGATNMVIGLVIDNRLNQFQNSN
jgi:hypothetical protein